LYAEGEYGRDLDTRMAVPADAQLPELGIMGF
jgi:hypothetical protein